VNKRPQKIEVTSSYSVQNPIFLSIFCLAIFSFSLSSCVSHLNDAKFYYSQGQDFSRHYKTEKAIAAFKRAKSEAQLELKRRPSSQAYMLKGMAELNLKLWKEAEQSFINAFSYGFEKGEEWARQVSLLGLALSLEAFQLKDTAFEIYIHLINKSHLRPITILAAQKYSEKIFKRALQHEGKEKKKLLSGALKNIKRLASKDLACGFYHYLQSQIHSHLSDYKKSFEEAVMAKELGLSSEEIYRDNDLQIVYCYLKLKEHLNPEGWEAFQSVYREWVKKWGWKDPETPGWKKEK
jgi:hypothetical protein